MLFGGLGVLTAGVGLGAWQTAPFRYYDGPTSDIFDGTRFLDARHGMPPKGLPEVLRWYRDRQQAEWPEWNPSSFADRPKCSGTYDC